MVKVTRYPFRVVCVVKSALGGVGNTAGQF
jgi:hypothetical protein